MHFSLFMLCRAHFTFNLFSTPKINKNMRKNLSKLFEIFRRNEFGNVSAVENMFIFVEKDEMRWIFGWFGTFLCLFTSSFWPKKELYCNVIVSMAIKYGNRKVNMNLGLTHCDFRKKFYWKIFKDSVLFFCRVKKGSWTGGCYSNTEQNSTHFSNSNGLFACRT